ncbi:MAG TPA: hypothetical protein DCX07_05260 [Phycisphaerales bacterium]|nr:hypothetical protein [Phycisphaerales bacterium]
MPRWRTRLAVALLSLAVLALELGLMRALSLKFWHHFAYLIISIALLGFGASGTMLTLLRRRVLARPRACFAGLAGAFAISVPLLLRVAECVPLNMRRLAWDFSQFWNAAMLQLLLFAPFFLAASAIGIALMDRPQRVTGHYVANLVGSGIGALGAVVLMHVLSTSQLLLATAAAGYCACAAVLSWRRTGIAAAGGALAVVLIAVGFGTPYEPKMSEYKTLSMLLETPKTEIVHRSEGPLGRLDVVTGQVIHSGPGLGVACPFLMPPQSLVLLDGEKLGSLFRCDTPSDWAFMDYTTSAVAYHLRERPRVLILGAGGGEQIGLALYHRSREVTALESNPQLIAAMAGPLASLGGDIYRKPGVTVRNVEPRGYLAGTDKTFDVIQLAGDGSAAGGLRAMEESYLYTVEAFTAMLDRLDNRGVLVVTRCADLPREGLRVLDTAAQALRGRGKDPAQRLATIRNLFTVTVLASNHPLDGKEILRIRQFAETVPADVCILPGLEKAEADVKKEERDYYVEGARALLGPDRDRYLADPLFYISESQEADLAALGYCVAAPTDDKPYFFHFLGWRQYAAMHKRLGPRARDFLELGYLLAFAALGQAILLAAVLIVAPLLPGVRALRGTPGRTAAMGYFLMIGAGFMLLEMGFLQKLVLYLAHPIYSAALVISSFLIFAGGGSLLSLRWRSQPRCTACAAGLTVVLVAAVYLFFLDGWLARTQAQPIALRFLLAAAAIAPLALAMGHMFPLALRQVGTAAPALVPWAWAVNGFASVGATVAAPLLAMQWGFSVLTLTAVVCYVLAALFARLLPRVPESSDEHRV